VAQTVVIPTSLADRSAAVDHFAVVATTVVMVRNVAQTLAPIAVALPILALPSAFRAARRLAHAACRISVEISAPHDAAPHVVAQTAVALNAAALNVLAGQLVAAAATQSPPGFARASQLHPDSLA